MTPDDEAFLRQAIGLAAAAHERGDAPFGAVLVASGQVVHQATDGCRAYGDPTAHAELLAISEHCRARGTLDLDGYTLYSSAEPCVQCAGAIKWARVSRVVFSVSQAMLQRMSGGRPKPSCAEIVNTGNRPIEVRGPLLSDEGLAVFAEYDFAPKRDWVKPAEAIAPPLGQVRFGDLRRVEPLTRSFGFERGQPVDRYYIERFLERHAADVRGRVLEIGEDIYTRRFGRDRVHVADVLDLKADNPRATFVADLTRAEQVPSEAFDCVIFTQTLQFIYDAPAAIRTLHRILKPGGVLLGTFPAVSQICRYDMERWGDYWRFTTASIRRLLGDAFGPERVTVGSYGNVLAAASFLYGLAAEDLRPRELDAHDPDYELLIVGRAVRG